MLPQSKIKVSQDPAPPRPQLTVLPAPQLLGLRGPSSLCPPLSSLPHPLLPRSSLCLWLMETLAHLGDLTSRSLSHPQGPFFQVRPCSEVLGVRTWTLLGHHVAQWSQGLQEREGSTGNLQTRRLCRLGTHRVCSPGALSQERWVLSCLSDPLPPPGHSPFRHGGDDADAERAGAPDPHAAADAQSPAPASARARPPAPHPTGRQRRPLRPRQRTWWLFFQGRVHLCRSPGLRSALKPPSAPGSRPSGRAGCAVQGPGSCLLGPVELCWSLALPCPSQL